MNGGHPPRHGPDPSSLVDGLRSEAARLGLARLGIAPPDPSEHSTFYRWWIDNAFHGAMGYLARPDAVARRADLSLTLDEVRSVVVVAEPTTSIKPFNVNCVVLSAVLNGFVNP